MWKTSLVWLGVNHFVSYLPSRRVRMLLLRLFGARIGKGTTMFMGAEIRNPSGLTIGTGCSFGPRVLLDARAGLVIGNNVTVAREAMFWTVHHDYNDVRFRNVGGSVHVGDHAWVCSRAIVLPGVRIGTAAVVGSGAVVTKDVEPHTVVGGIPATQIATRRKQQYDYVPAYPLHMV